LNYKRNDDTFADVAFGSQVTLKHWNTQVLPSQQHKLNLQGGYLHSHTHVYPGGSEQQQITLYPHKDDNNNWLLSNQTDPEIPVNASGRFQLPRGSLYLEPLFVENSAVIRLEHILTEKRLHSHDVRPPVSEVEWQNEVSGYGFPGFEGDANDFFRVEIVKEHSRKGVARKRVRYKSVQHKT
jgi:dolichyl-phosphate-mannose-protein mannosyltransferase